MRKLKMVLTLVITLLVLSIPLFDCSATFFDRDFPSYTGLSSGYYIELRCDLGTCALFFRESDLGSLCLTVNGDLFNPSNTAVQGTVFVNGNTAYTLRVNARNLVQYGLPSGNTTTWHYFNNVVFLGTNIDFKNVNPTSSFANSNLYFSKFEVAILSVSISVLFFTMLNWWLLHERRIKSH